MTVSAPSPAEARASHSVASALREAITVWFALLGAVGAWIVHLVALSALAGLGCTEAGARLAMHAITAGCLLVGGAALVLAARLAASGADDDGVGASSRRRFVGLLGLIIGVTQVALIVAEEIDVVIFAGGPCG